MGTIYVWMPVGDSVGHCSLLLNNGTYISWWPRDDKCKHKKTKKKISIHGPLPDTYDKDKEEMGRHATNSFCIHCYKIDVYCIDSWWREYITEGGGYHLISHNCCDVVLKALKNGGAFEWVHPGIKVISTPRYMSKYSRDLEIATERCSVWSRLKVKSFHPFW